MKLDPARRNPVYRQLAAIILGTLIIAAIAGSILIAYLDHSSAEKLDAVRTRLRAEGAILSSEDLRPVRIRETGADLVDPGGDAAVKFLIGMNERYPELVEPVAANEARVDAITNSELLAPHAPILPSDYAEWADEIEWYLEYSSEELAALMDVAMLPPSTMEGIRRTIGTDSTIVWGWKIPNLIAMRGLAQLAALDALARIDEGDCDGAIDSIRAGIEFGHHVRDLPGIIQHSMSEVIYAMELKAMERLAARPLHDAHIEALWKTFAAVDSSRAFEQAVRIELLWLECVQLEMIQPSQAGGVPHPIGLLYGARPARFWRQYDLAYTLAASHDVLTSVVSSGPSNLVPLRVAIAAFDTDIRQQEYRYPLAAMASNAGWSSFFERSVKNRGMLQAMLEVAEASLAVIRFANKHGTYPDSLDELVPAYLSAAPLDPFTGEPLHYGLEGDGFVVYSVGPDFDDDGGVKGPAEDGDIVWDLSARPPVAVE